MGVAWGMVLLVGGAEIRVQLGLGDMPAEAGEGEDSVISQGGMRLGAHQ